jgi:hypothetical protein
MTEAEKRATKLLHAYDKKRKELRELERELHAACQEYGRELRITGFNKDYLRTRMNMERERIEREEANKAA